MNITFFIGGLSGGGAERVICNLANYLASRGHEIEILTMSDDKPSYALCDKVQRVSLLRSNERKSFIYNSILRFVRFLKYITKNRFDIYVVMLPITTIMLLGMRKLIKSKVIAAERNNPASCTARIQMCLKEVACNADGWVFQTEEACNWYGKSIENSKSIIIPNAINSEFIKPAYIGHRKKVIVTVGRLTEQKNHVLLVKAFAKICSKNPDYNLIIYGEGSLKKRIEETATRLNINDWLELPGYSTNISEKIKDASLFVLSSDFEGMPNALMEAMALGLPCISTDCDGGGARFLIENEKNGLLVPKGDVDALADAMKRMLSDREFAEKCAQEAHKICERLAPEKIYGEWENFIKEIVNK